WLCRSLAGAHTPIWVGRALLVVCGLAWLLLGAPQAHAQVPHLAISELTFSLAGPDNTREYVEIANLGDTAWNPNNHWVLRAADADATQQLFVRVQGVDPVPPGDVLLLEWGRPIAGVACTTKGNVFCT